MYVRAIKTFLYLAQLSEFEKASSQTLFGTELDPDGAAQLSREVTSDMFAHSGDCAAPSYSSMEEVD
ncbi:hypothetical protein DNTS_003701 [Danionella cerebrum]|uniref:Uncharacterized protein n=1 Tax=Danionella cerebrum TaxID=2873325 RepID=A0A553QKX1_9TELE|nr:hypothetical protein DNTS_003701 [Danionella translucida]